ncbi:thioesterase domain-containing protein [Micromonospora sp. NPDC023814]|uniref:thioesterase domain-containing protein n=1 Tax=Micromonospora sp. NPDC023814 TaxID=3154596 RepID=UPI0033C1F6F4
MARTIALRQVSEGRSGCLLTVEFAGDSAGPGLAATLAEAEAEAEAGVDGATGAGAARRPGGPARGGRHEIWRLDPVTSLELHPGLPGHRDLADACAAEFLRLRPADAGPVTVVGYCSAAVFAHHLARALADAGGPPVHLVLVAATVPDEETVRREYAVLHRKLAGESAPAGPVPLLADPEETVDRMRHELTRLARAFAAANGFDPAEAETAADEIAGRYLAWLWFLLDAAGTGPAPVPCPVVEARDDAEALGLLRAWAVDGQTAGTGGDTGGRADGNGPRDRGAAMTGRRGTR